jgi:hypothetical protein
LALISTASRQPPAAETIVTQGWEAKLKTPSSAPRNQLQRQYNNIPSGVKPDTFDLCTYLQTTT